MASLPSGTANVDTELVVIETRDFTLYIKGKPYHERYEGLENYKMIAADETTEVVVTGETLESVSVFDLKKGDLGGKTTIPPIFFENQVYQLVVTPKNNKNLSFYHEHPSLRGAVTKVGREPQHVLMGTLQFQNEVGFTSFEIREDSNVLLKVKIEIYPIKLNYKEDYRKLIDEVNEEVYNLAFHFIKKTYLSASSSITTEKSSWSEFYRLFEQQFERFMKATNLVERQPHHKLEKIHVKKRGDQLKKLDSIGRSYVRKRPYLLMEVPNGIEINNQKVMPTLGMNVKKELTYNTLENQFMKWMIVRLVDKLTDLSKVIATPNHPYQTDRNVNEEILKKIARMKHQLEAKLRTPFWKEIDLLTRSMMSLVMQMAPGYREAYQIYLIVSRSLILQNDLYNMSVKDVATLYEYWTFIKLGKILAAKYPMVSQNIIKVRRNGLFVTLDQSASAKRVFKHPVTNEKIMLHFQKLDKSLPTVNQKPDTILSIEKVGKDYTYQYIFDAKYRVDFATEGTYYKQNYKTAGPLEDDINTMHRYRDALVVKENGPYERYAFGAYVLFPWFDEEGYESHYFYKSIDSVNIGGFPFLPNSYQLVEKFLERLIEKNPEELQQEGILPRGSLVEWNYSIDEKVMVAKVEKPAHYQTFLQEKKYIIPLEYLKKGWQEAKYIALYLPKSRFDTAGVTLYGEIDEVNIINKSELYEEATFNNYVEFIVKVWKSITEPIKPINYGIQYYMITSLTQLKTAKELPELFMKSSMEMNLWKTLRRLSSEVKTELNHNQLDQADMVTSYSVDNMTISLSDNESITITKNDSKFIISIKELQNNPSKIFKKIVQIIN